MLHELMIEWETEEEQELEADLHVDGVSARFPLPAYGQGPHAGTTLLFTTVIKVIVQQRLQHANTHTHTTLLTSNHDSLNCA